MYFCKESASQNEAVHYKNLRKDNSVVANAQEENDKQDGVNNSLLQSAKFTIKLPINMA
jgi:hypothetical protein